MSLLVLHDYDSPFWKTHTWMAVDVVSTALLSKSLVSFFNPHPRNRTITQNYSKSTKKRSQIKIYLLSFPLFFILSSCPPHNNRLRHGNPSKIHQRRKRTRRLPHSTSDHQICHALSSFTHVRIQRKRYQTYTVLINWFFIRCLHSQSRCWCSCGRESSAYSQPVVHRQPIFF